MCTSVTTKHKIMCKTRILRDEAAFWKREAENFTRRKSREESKNFKNLFENGYKEFVESNLNALIKDMTRGKVDMTLSLEEGTQMFAIMNCKFISKAIRDELCRIIYPGFVEDLIANIQNVDNVNLEEGMSLVRIIQCELVEEDLRTKLRNIIYPIFIKQLINDIQTGIIDRDEITWGDLDRITLLIDSNVNPELCSKLSSVIYGADEQR